ncbi:MAG: hypothetical protein ACRD2N_07830 [Vicinamibacterales bacterium]
MNVPRVFPPKQPLAPHAETVYGLVVTGNDRVSAQPMLATTMLLMRISMEPTMHAQAAVITVKVKLNVGVQVAGTPRPSI